MKYENNGHGKYKKLKDESMWIAYHLFNILVLTEIFLTPIQTFNFQVNSIVFLANYFILAFLIQIKSEQTVSKLLSIKKII